MFSLGSTTVRTAARSAPTALYGYFALLGWHEGPWQISHLVVLCLLGVLYVLRPTKLLGVALAAPALLLLVMVLFAGSARSGSDLFVPFLIVPITLFLIAYGYPPTRASGIAEDQIRSV